MTKIKKILCPVDFFPASIRAVIYAARLAASTNASVYLFHVMANRCGRAAIGRFAPQEAAAAARRFRKPPFYSWIVAPPAVSVPGA